MAESKSKTTSAVAVAVADADADADKLAVSKAYTSTLADKLSLLHARLRPVMPCEINPCYSSIRICLQDGLVLTRHTNKSPRLSIMGDQPYCCCGWSVCPRVESDFQCILPKEGGKAILSIASTNGGAMFAMSEDTVYAWGAGQNGELPDGEHTCVRQEPTVVLRLPSGSRTLVQLIASQRVGAVRTSLGELFTWGCNVWGAGHAEEKTRVESRVDKDGNIVRPSIPSALTTKNIIAACYLPSRRYAEDGLIVITSELKALASKRSSTWTEIKMEDALESVLHALAP